jgi:hypothetical protein
MKIECDTTFLDGTERFEAGDIRTVDDARGYKFIGLGWAHAAGQSAPAPAVEQTPVTLDIHNVLQTSQVTHG